MRACGPSAAILHGCGQRRRFAAEAEGAAPEEARRQEASSFTALSADGRCIVVGTTCGQVQALSASSGGVLWTRECDGGSRPASVIFSPDNTSVIAGAGGLVLCLDAQSGDRRWAFGLGLASPRHLAISRDGACVLVGADDGTLFALAARSGCPLWQCAVGEALPDDWRLLVGRDNSALYFWAGDGRLHAVAVSSGERVWAHDPGTSMPSDWVVDESPDGASLYYASSVGEICSVNATSGCLQWTHHAGQPLAARAVGPDGAHVLATAGNGTLLAIAAATGEPRWTCDLPGQTEHMCWSTCLTSPDGATVFVGDMNQRSVQAVAADSGQQRWERQLGGTLVRVAVDAHGANILCLDTSNQLQCLSSATGEVTWAMAAFEDDLDGHLLLSADGTTAFLTLHSGHLLALQTSSGEVRWRLRLGVEAAAETSDKPQISGSAWIQKKRYAVVLVLLLVLALHRSGRLKRPSGGGTTPELEDILGESVAAKLQVELGLRSAGASADSGSASEQD